ncbi:MAG: AI-2E family transporter [Syntrophothermus sp.]
MDQKKTPLKTTALFFIILMGVGAAFYFLRLLQDILVPFVTAYFLYFVFEPVNNYLKKWRFPVWLQIGADLLIMVLVIAVISSFIIGAFSSFGDKLPDYQEKLSSLVSNTAKSLGINDPSLRNFKLSNLAKQIDFTVIAGGVFTSTFSFLGSMVVMFVLFVFIAAGHPLIYKALDKRFSKMPDSGEETGEEKNKRRGNNKFRKTFSEIEKEVRKYFTSKVIISLITAVSEGLTIFFFGVDFAIVWGVLIFFLNFIPNVGSLIGLALPCLAALVEFDSLIKAIAMIISLFVLDSILGYFVEPVMFSDTLKMNPLIIIIGLLAWSYLWGIMGALLAVPIMQVFRIIISKSDSPNLILIDDLMRNE